MGFIDIIYIWFFSEIGKCVLNRIRAIFNPWQELDLPRAAGQIRTADLILTKQPRRFFLTIFSILWPFSLRSACFPSLFEYKVSAYSAAVCGWLCGQVVGKTDFRDLTVCTKVVRARFLPAVIISCPTFMQFKVRLCVSLPCNEALQYVGSRKTTAHSLLQIKIVGAPLLPSLPRATA